MFLAAAVKREGTAKLPRRTVISPRFPGPLSLIHRIGAKVSAVSARKDPQENWQKHRKVPQENWHKHRKVPQENWQNIWKYA